jgi:hypothetical protein
VRSLCVFGLSGSAVTTLQVVFAQSQDGPLFEILQYLRPRVAARLQGVSRFFASAVAGCSLYWARVIGHLALREWMRDSATRVMSVKWLKRVSYKIEESIEDEKEQYELFCGLHEPEKLNRQLRRIEETVKDMDEQNWRVVSLVRNPLWAKEHWYFMTEVGPGDAYKREMDAFLMAVREHLEMAFEDLGGALPLEEFVRIATRFTVKSKRSLGWGMSVLEEEVTHVPLQKIGRNILWNWVDVTLDADRRRMTEFVWFLAGEENLHWQEKRYLSRSIVRAFTYYSPGYQGMEYNRCPSMPLGCASSHESEFLCAMLWLPELLQGDRQVMAKNAYSERIRKLGKKVDRMLVEREELARTVKQRLVRSFGLKPERKEWRDSRWIGDVTWEQSDQYLRSLFNLPYMLLRFQSVDDLNKLVGY